MLFYDIWKRQVFDLSLPSVAVENFCHLISLLDWWVSEIFYWILTILVKCFSCSWNNFLPQKSLVMLCRHTLKCNLSFGIFSAIYWQLTWIFIHKISLSHTKREKTNSTPLESQVCNISFFLCRSLWLREICLKQQRERGLSGFSNKHGILTWYERPCFSVTTMYEC